MSKEFYKRVFPKKSKSEELGKERARMTMEKVAEIIKNSGDHEEMTGYFLSRIQLGKSRNTKAFYQELAFQFNTLLQSFCIFTDNDDNEDLEKLKKDIVWSIKNNLKHNEEEEEEE